MGSRSYLLESTTCKNDKLSERHFQAASKFCADAGKAGVGKDAASATRMSLDEAQKILGISKEAPLEEVLKVRLPSDGDCVSD